MENMIKFRSLNIVFTIKFNIQIWKLKNTHYFIKKSVFLWL